MKKLLITLACVLAIPLIASTAFALSYKFDFDDDTVWDTNWTLQPPPVGETVQVKLWLDDNYTCPPDDKIFGVELFFQYNPSKIQVNDVIPNDQDHGGPFSPSYTLPRSGEPLCDSGTCLLVLAASELTYITVENNQILLFTIELQALEEGSTDIVASGNIFP